MHFRTSRTRAARSSSSRLPIVLAAFAGALFPAAASAQEEDEQEIVVTAPLEGSRIESLQGAEVLNRDDIVEQLQWRPGRYARRNARHRHHLLRRGRQPADHPRTGRGSRARAAERHRRDRCFHRFAGSRGDVGWPGRRAHRNSARRGGAGLWRQRHWRRRQRDRPDHSDARRIERRDVRWPRRLLQRR